MWGDRVVRAGGTGRLAAGACLVAALVGAGCAREADGDLVAGSESEASAGVLVEAAGRSSAQPYRYELDMSMWAVDTGGSFALGFTVIGVVDGDRQSASMDMTEMFEETGGLPQTWPMPTSPWRRSSTATRCTSARRSSPRWPRRHGRTG